MVKVRIDFPPDLAKERSLEARNWKEGDPLIWECEDYNVKVGMAKKDNGDVEIKTEHVNVVLHKDEVEQLKNL